MSETLWAQVAERLNEHDYMNGIERTVSRVRANGEVFTPTALVIEILRNCDLGVLAPGKTVLDPACGDGQFLCAAKWLKILHFGMEEAAALGELYGVDIMRDNVDLCARRLGGGTILMGDTLKPARRLEGQTDDEWHKMQELFEGPRTRIYKRKRVSRMTPDGKSLGSKLGRGVESQASLF